MYPSNHRSSTKFYRVAYTFYILEILFFFVCIPILSLLFVKDPISSFPSRAFEYTVGLNFPKTYGAQFVALVALALVLIHPVITIVFGRKIWQENHLKYPWVSFLAFAPGPSFWWLLIPFGPVLAPIALTWGAIPTVLSYLWLAKKAKQYSGPYSWIIPVALAAIFLGVAALGEQIPKKSYTEYIQNSKDRYQIENSNSTRYAFEHDLVTIVRLHYKESGSYPATPNGTYLELNLENPFQDIHLNALYHQTVSAETIDKMKQLKPIGFYYASDGKRSFAICSLRINAYKENKEEYQITYYDDPGATSSSSYEKKVDDCNRYTYSSYLPAVNPVHDQ